MKRLARPALLLGASARARPVLAPTVSPTFFRSYYPRAAASSSIVLSTRSREGRDLLALAAQRRQYSGGGPPSEAVIKERLLAVIKNFHKVDPNVLTEKSHFLNDLGLDSLDTVELILAIEDEFCIEIPEEQGDKIQTVEDALSYLTTNPSVK